MDLSAIMAMALLPSPPGGRALATSNPIITGNWSLIVQEGDEFLLTLPLASQAVHVAIGAADEATAIPTRKPRPPIC